MMFSASKSKRFSSNILYFNVDLDMAVLKATVVSHVMTNANQTHWFLVQYAHILVGQLKLELVQVSSNLTMTAIGKAGG